MVYRVDRNNQTGWIQEIKRNGAFHVAGAAATVYAASSYALSWIDSQPRNFAWDGARTIVGLVNLSAGLTFIGAAAKGVFDAKTKHTRQHVADFALRSAAASVRKDA